MSDKSPKNGADLIPDQPFDGPAFDIWLDRAVADQYRAVLNEELPHDLLELLDTPS